MVWALSFVTAAASSALVAVAAAAMSSCGDGWRDTGSNEGWCGA